MPEESFATDLIMNSDLTDLRYLYQFGEYISENEWKTAEHLNSLPEETIGRWQMSIQKDTASDS